MPKRYKEFPQINDKQRIDNSRKVDKRLERTFHKGE